MLQRPRNIMRTLDYSGACFCAADSADTGAGRRIRPATGGSPTASPTSGSPNATAACGASSPGRKRRAAATEQSGCLKTEQADAGHADPDRHEEEARRRSVGRPGLQRQGRPRSTARRSSRSVPISSRFKAACSAFCAAAKPGPASPVRSRQAPPTAWPTVRRKPPARYQSRLRRRPPRRRKTTAAPKTTGSVNAGAKGQKLAPSAQPADPVGDICLLPDIAGFAH